MFIVDNQQMKLVGKVTPILQQQERPIGIGSELIYSVGVKSLVLFWTEIINVHFKNVFYFKMIFFALIFFYTGISFRKYRRVWLPGSAFFLRKY